LKENATKDEADVDMGEDNCNGDVEDESEEKWTSCLSSFLVVLVFRLSFVSVSLLVKLQHSF